MQQIRERKKNPANKVWPAGKEKKNIRESEPKSFISSRKKKDYYIT